MNAEVSAVPETVAAREAGRSDENLTWTATAR